jgi:DNA-binding response OmpR family regulator
MDIRLHRRNTVKKAAPPETIVPILAVGGTEADQKALSEILTRSAAHLCPGSKWSLQTSPNLTSALSTLRQQPVPIVICESDLGAASWRELWAQVAQLPDPPFLIVTSRLADEYLWAEALNLGAYDVLAKPFHPAEVIRSVSQAWLHRSSRRTSRPMAAVGRAGALNPEGALAV